MRRLMTEICTGDTTYTSTVTNAYYTHMCIMRSEKSLPRPSEGSLLYVCVLHEDRQRIGMYIMCTYIGTHDYPWRMLYTQRFERTSISHHTDDVAQKKAGSTLPKKERVLPPNVHTLKTCSFVLITPCLGPLLTRLNPQINKERKADITHTNERKKPIGRQKRRKREDTYKERY